MRNIEPVNEYWFELKKYGDNFAFYSRFKSNKSLYKTQNIGIKNNKLNGDNRIYLSYSVKDFGEKYYKTDINIYDFVNESTLFKRNYIKKYKIDEMMEKIYKNPSNKITYISGSIEKEDNDIYLFLTEILCKEEIKSGIGYSKDNYFKNILHLSAKDSCVDINEKYLLLDNGTMKEVK